MSEFELNSDDGLLGVSALAKKMGVSDETVYNFEKRGMAAVKIGGDGKKLWEPGAALEWREKNAPARSRGHGGKRRSAGRKTKEFEDEALREEVTGTLASVFRDAEERLRAMGVDGSVAKQAGDVEALLEAIKGDTLTLGELERVAAGLKAVKELIAVRKAEGELVPRREAEIEYGQHLTVIRTTLEGFPGRAAPELAAALKLPADSVAEIRGALEEQMGHVYKQLER